jgi:signal transduction histidine kinase
VCGTELIWNPARATFQPARTGRITLQLDVDQEIARNRFLAIVAHELRSPLMPILNGASVLRRSPGDQELVTRTAQIIERQGRLLSGLIEDLLDVSRTQRGQLLMRPRRIRVQDVIDLCVETAAPLLRENRQRLVISVAPDSMELHGDLNRLGQALQNLISNAAKFSERGGIIRIRAERQEADAVVTIVDQGIGIEARNLESIFALYRRVGDKSIAQDAGLGIGLYLARYVAEAHGGTVTATSEGLGRGSCFRLQLPCLEFYPAASSTRFEPSSRSLSAFTTL